MNGRKNIIVLRKTIRLVVEKSQFEGDRMGFFPFTLNNWDY